MLSKILNVQEHLVNFLDVLLKLCQIRGHRTLWNAVIFGTACKLRLWFHIGCKLPGAQFIQLFFVGKQFTQLFFSVRKLPYVQFTLVSVSKLPTPDEIELEVRI